MRHKLLSHWPGLAGRGEAAAAGESTGASGGTAGQGAAGASSTPTLTGCATWKLQSASGATSTITLVDGGIELFRPGDASNTQTVFNSDDVAISQAGLTGDFDILVTYDHFQPGEAMPFWGPKFEAARA